SNITRTDLINADRKWSLMSFPSAEEWMKSLDRNEWRLCTAFYVAGRPDYLFLNDTEPEKAPTRLALVKRLADGSLVHLASLAVCWCLSGEIMGFILNGLHGDFDDEGLPVELTVQAPEEHGRCPYCE